MKHDEAERLEAVVRGANPVPFALDLADSDHAYAVTLLVERRRHAMTTAPLQAPPESASSSPRRRRAPAWSFAVGFVVSLAVAGAALMFVVADDTTTVTDQPDGALTLVDTTTPLGDEVHTLTGPIERVAAVAWSPDGTRVVTAIDGTANVWDATRGVKVPYQQLDHIGDVSAVVWSPVGKGIAIAAGEESGVYDAATGDRLLGPLPDQPLAFSPDGTRLAVGGAWGAAAVLDVTTGDEQFALPLAPSWVWAATWSPDGTRFATTWGTYIKVWDGATGEELLTIGSATMLLSISNDMNVTDVAWSPDGTRIATASRDGTVGVWDAATGDEQFALPLAPSWVWTVAWSPDGTRIATAGDDEITRIWSAESGDEQATLTGHAGRVTDVAWSPDGTRIATASQDGTVKIWNVS